jgi:TolB protein
MLTLLLIALQNPVGVANDPLLKDAQESHLVNIRQLTFGGQNAEAYWNEDGTAIIYQTTQPEWPDEQIMTMYADGSGKKLVSSGKGRTTCGYYLPGSKEIVYSATAWKDPGPAPKADMSKGYVWRVNPYYRIFKAKADGSGAKMLLPNMKGYQAESTVAPNGKFMVFTSTQDGDLEIYRCDLDGKNVKRLTNSLGYDGGPFVSWDSSKVVFRRGVPKNAAEEKEYKDLLKQDLVRPTKLEIWVMDPDGRNQKRVTNLGCASFAPFMHPDGKRIIFSSNYGDPQGREFDLYVINVDGTGLQRITFAKDFDGFPMFSRDGKKLIWASNRNGKVPHETNIFVADWTDTPTPKPEPPPTPNPSGRRVRVGLMPNYTDGGPGLLLDGVVEGSPAELAGLKQGDRIVKWGDTKINDIQDIQAVFESAEPGKPVKVTILRGGKEIVVTVTPTSGQVHG